MSTKTIKIDEKLHTVIKTVSAKNKKSMQSYIEDAMKEYIEEHSGTFVKQE